jgi:hypothetical protein
MQGYNGMGGGIISSSSEYPKFVTSNMVVLYYVGIVVGVFSFIVLGVGAA